MQKMTSSANIRGDYMSRSYKKKTILKDKNKGMKTIANRKVRNRKDIPSGMAYKKVFETYAICDWISFVSEEEYIDICYKNLEFSYNDVEIIYLGKKNKWIFKADGRLKPNYSYRDWYKNYKGK